MKFAGDELDDEGFPIVISPSVIFFTLILARGRLVIGVLWPWRVGHLLGGMHPLAGMGAVGRVPVGLPLGLSSFPGDPAPGLLAALPGGLGPAAGHALLLLGEVHLAVVKFLSEKNHFESKLFYLILL